MKAIRKQALNLLGVLGISLGLTGCVVAIGSGSHSSPAPQPTIVVTDSAEAATVAEIDAASRLNFDNARAHALTQIAERGALPVPVQVHLINVAYRCLDFENNKVFVLDKMIARPDFCDATRQAIVSQLNKLGLDHNRQFILQRINERLKNSTPH